MFFINNDADAIKKSDTHKIDSECISVKFIQNHNITKKTYSIKINDAKIIRTRVSNPPRIGTYTHV
jgi:histidyl-tRNA synthetase